jgi:uncharacterized repeat protein (TIGR04138 family)
MHKHTFGEALGLILGEDPRYTADAYGFVREGLDFTIKMRNKPESGPGRHVSGQELLEGLRLLALQEFGPLACTVLKSWGVTRTEDFGEIVFNLVNKGVLGKTPEDRKEDFAGGYDFHAAFVQPFLPAASKQTAEQPAGKRGARKRCTARQQDNS